MIFMDHGIWNTQREIRTPGRAIGTDEPSGGHRWHESEWDWLEKSVCNGKRVRHKLWRKETLGKVRNKAANSSNSERLLRWTEQGKNSVSEVERGENSQKKDVNQRVKHCEIRNQVMLQKRPDDLHIRRSSVPFTRTVELARYEWNSDHGEEGRVR